MKNYMTKSWPVLAMLYTGAVLPVRQALGINDASFDEDDKQFIIPEELVKEGRSRVLEVNQYLVKHRNGKFSAESHVWVESELVPVDNLGTQMPADYGHQDAGPGAGSQIPSSDTVEDLRHNAEEHVMDSAGKLEDNEQNFPAAEHTDDAAEKTEQ